MRSAARAPILATLALTALVVAPATSAPAKAGHTRHAANNSRAERIVVAGLHAVAATRQSAVTADIGAANAAISPCLASFTTITQSQDPLDVAAAPPLLSELLASYSALALHTEYAALARMGMRLAGAHLRAGGLQTFGTAVSGIATLDFCADLTAWQAAGLAAAAEPAGTARATAAESAASAIEKRLRALASARRPLAARPHSRSARRLHKVAQGALKRLRASARSAQTALAGLTAVP